MMMLLHVDAVSSPRQNIKTKGTGVVVSGGLLSCVFQQT